MMIVIILSVAFMTIFNTKYNTFMMTVVIKILRKIGNMIFRTIGGIIVLITESRTKTIMVRMVAAIIVMFVPMI